MSFNVVINSETNVSTNDPGGNSNNNTYAIDWSFMDECEYDVTFAFRGSYDNWEGTGAISASDMMGIELRGLGAVSNTYNAGSEPKAGGSNFLGVTHMRTQYHTAANGGAKEVVFAAMSDNAPIRFKARPQSNTFDVRLLTDNYDLSVSPPLTYTLVLHFKKIDRY